MRLKITNPGHASYGSCQALQRAFAIAVRMLEVEYHAATVELTINPQAAGLHPDGTFTKGEADSHVQPGSVFRVDLNVDHVPDAIHTLCHELTHVAQQLTGRTQGCLCKGGTLWEGREFYDSQHLLAAQCDRQLYLALPWEVEARREADRLFQAIARREIALGYAEPGTAPLLREAA